MFTNDEVTFLLKTTLGSSKLAIILTNNDGLITLFSSGAEEMFGYFSGELELKQFSSILFDPVESVSRFQEGRFILRKKEGNRFPVKINVSSIINSNSEIIGFLAIITDLSYLENLQIIVDNQHLQIVEMAKLASVSELASVIAHEMSNPLSIIQANSFFLLENVKKKDVSTESLLSYLTMALSVCDRLDKVIKNLRTVAHSSVEGYFIPVSIRKLTEKVMTLFEEKLKNENIRINFVMEEEDIIASCSSVQISQVLINLINNAYEAIKNLETKWINLELKLINNGNSLECSVTDSGAGLSNDLVEKIMKPFFSTKENLESVGIGLPFSRRIIEKHSGHLFVDNNCKNTKLVFDIPLQR